MWYGLVIATHKALTKTKAVNRISDKIITMLQAYI